MPRYDWLFSMAAAALCACVGTGNDRRTASGDVDLAGATRPAVLADSIVQRADSLIRAGRPWRAALVPTPLLVTPNTASPQARLVRAPAAPPAAGRGRGPRAAPPAPRRARRGPGGAAGGAARGAR